MLPPLLNMAVSSLFGSNGEATRVKEVPAGTTVDPMAAIVKRDVAPVGNAQPVDWGNINIEGSNI